MICSPTLYSVWFPTKWPCKLTLFSVVACVWLVVADVLFEVPVSPVLAADSVVELGGFVVVTCTYVILYLFSPTGCKLVAVNPGYSFFNCSRFSEKFDFKIATSSTTPPGFSWVTITNSCASTTVEFPVSVLL